MSKCPECRNEFVQPFVCTTCGAQKLHDSTMTSLHQRNERLTAELAEARGLLRTAQVTLDCTSEARQDKCATAIHAFLSREIK